MTKVLKNILSKNTPIWFRKMRKTVTLLSDASIVILLGVGYAENSLMLLVMRVGISAVMSSIEVFLTNEPDA